MKVISFKIQRILESLEHLNNEEYIVTLNNLDIFNIEHDTNPHEIDACSIKITKIYNKFIINLFHLPTSGSYLNDIKSFPRIKTHQFIVLHHLLNHFQNDKKYIISMADEAPTMKYLIREFSNLCKECGIHYKNIIFTGSDFFAKSTILKMNKNEDTPLFPYFLNWKMINHTGIDSIPTADDKFKINDIKKYKSTCLFGRIDIHRINFVHKLYNINYFTNDNLYSCFSPHHEKMSIDTKNYFKDISNQYLNIHDNLEKIIEECKIGEFSLGEDFINAEIMRFVPYDNDSYLWITVESTPSVHDVMFITEKSLKSYLWYKPLIVYGPPFTLKTLKELGFIDVFELMGFDSSYDNEVNDEIRLNKIIKQIDIFNKKSINDLDKLYKEESVKSALVNNNLHLKKLIGSDEYLQKVFNESHTIYPYYISDTKVDKFIKSNLETNIDTVKINNGIIDSDALDFFIK